MPKLSLGDRLACAALGGVFGIAYGALIGVMVASRGGGHFDVTYVKVAGAVFAALSFVIGPFIGDVIAGVIHFLLALFTLDLALSNLTLPDRVRGRLGLVASLVWLGAGTFVVILLAAHSW